MSGQVEALLAISRLENWDHEPVRYVELSVEGSRLWLGKGEIRPSSRIEHTLRNYDDPSRAKAALEAELKKYQRKGYTEHSTRQGPAPDLDRSLKLVPAPPKDSPEIAKAREEYTRRVRAAGIDPEVDFVYQANRSSRKGSDGHAAHKRDANARAAVCLAIARELLRFRLPPLRPRHGDLANDFTGGTGGIYRSANRIFEAWARKQREGVKKKR